MFFEKRTKFGGQKVATPKRRPTSKGLAARAEILTVVRTIPEYPTCFWVGWGGWAAGRGWVLCCDGALLARLHPEQATSAWWASRCYSLSFLWLTCRCLFSPEHHHTWIFLQVHRLSCKNSAADDLILAHQPRHPYTPTILKPSNLHRKREPEALITLLQCCSRRCLHCLNPPSASSTPCPLTPEIQQFQPHITQQDKSRTHSCRTR